MKKVLITSLSVLIFAGCKVSLFDEGKDTETIYKEAAWDEKIRKFSSCSEIDAYLQEYKQPEILIGDTVSSGDSQPSQGSSPQPYENQVAGVLEGDILQISDNFFFYATANKIEVTRRYPLAFHKSLPTPKSYVRSILLYEDKLIYVGHDYSKTTVQIYRVHEEVQKIYEKEFVGATYDFRLVGNHLRMISQHYSYGNRPVNDEQSCAQIYRPNLMDGQNVVTFVNILDLSNDKFSSNTTGYMGRADFNYMTSDELFLFSNSYLMPPHFRVVKFEGNSSSLAQVQTYQGYVKDRWSVLVKDHSIFLASTLGPDQKNPSAPRENKLFSYIKMRGLQYELAFDTPSFGHDETIRAVRYNMDKAYVVTFRQTDPLFVFDIKDAQNIKLLGSLESPGFSTQLRELTNGLMFGLGHAESQRHMKVSLFDVMDPLKPTETQALIWGDDKSIVWSYSLALLDSKALYISQEKDRIVFPAQITRAVTPSNNNQELMSILPGESNTVYEEFSGAIILDFDGRSVKEAGRVTHKPLRAKYCKESANNLVSTRLDIQRSVQIQGELFSFSSFGVTKSTAPDFATKEQVAFAASSTDCLGWY